MASDRDRKGEVRREAPEEGHALVPPLWGSLVLARATTASRPRLLPGGPLGLTLPQRILAKSCKYAASSLLIASLVLILYSSAALGQERPGVKLTINPPEDCYLSETVQPESIYSYLKVQIQALALAQRGEWSDSKMLESDGGARLEESAQTIAGLRAERLDNVCSSFLVSQYAGSKNPSMAATAKYLASAYDELGKMSNQMLGITLQKSLQRVNGPSPQAQFSKLMERRQEILGKMTDALKLLLAVLIDGNRTDAQGNLDHLVLSKDEIKEILDYLYSRFPSLKDDKKDDRPGNFIKQAALIQAYLTGSYRPADLP